ncbi:MAG: hypothetical protein ACTHOH_16595 [Lysobacteraceae bacterium]
MSAFSRRRPAGPVAGGVDAAIVHRTSAAVRCDRDTNEYTASANAIPDATVEGLMQERDRIQGHGSDWSIAIAPLVGMDRASTAASLRAMERARRS